MSHTRKLGLAAVTVGAVVLVVAFTLGFLLVASTARTREAFADAQSQRKQITEAKALLSRFVRTPKPSHADAGRAAGRLQELLEGLAEQKGCEIADYQSTDQLVPFATRFEKDTQEKGWGQMDVRATIHGRSSEVVSVLAGLTESPVPIEIDGITMTRSGLDREGRAVIDARLELRALLKSDKG